MEAVSRPCRMCAAVTSRVIGSGAVLCCICTKCLPTSLVNPMRLQDPTSVEPIVSIGAFQTALATLTGRGVLFRVKKQGWYLVLFPAELSIVSESPSLAEMTVHQRIYTIASRHGGGGAVLICAIRYALDALLRYLGNDELNAHGCVVVQLECDTDHLSGGIGLNGIRIVPKVGDVVLMSVVFLKIE